jgi:hypothetical protein
MKFKVEDFTDEVKKDNIQNDSEQYFRREIEDYRNNPYFIGQPIYLVCPQYTYEVEIQADKIEELLANGTLKVNGIYEATEFGISPPKEEALPNLEEDFEVLHEALYILDGVNAYRMEIPIYTVEKWVQDGLATPFPNNNSDMMFQKLKSTFQEYCQMNQIPYESWVNE